jgi:peptide/nickel transport system ATP-binding protein
MVLQARNLTVSMQTDGHMVDVLRDVSFDLAPGKVLGLVGESGAGKSMIGRVISRNLPKHFAVTHGSLAFAGRDMIKAPDDVLAGLLGDRVFQGQVSPQGGVDHTRGLAARLLHVLAQCRIDLHLPFKRIGQ